jgi:magnesium-transporting ATPase (P-type)
MEVFYLFSVRYLHSPSLTLRGVLGTPAVWVVIGLIMLLQWLFTYSGFMQSLFTTVPLSWSVLLLAPLAGVSVLMVLELEKRVRRL